jgi:hypothetical protein
VEDLPRIPKDVSGTGDVDVSSISLIRTTERPRRRLRQVFVFDFLPTARRPTRSKVDGKRFSRHFQRWN